MQETSLSLSPSPSQKYILPLSLISTPPPLLLKLLQADVAMLVIPATSGEFESSMSANAQTREHAVLLKALGVNQVIVVINKMDMTTPPWCKDRYAFIQSEMRTLLTGLQFGPKAIRFVPVSSLNGINLNPLSQSSASASAPLVKSSSSESTLNNISYARGVPCPELFKWYIGPSLVELLDTFKSPPREINKPLRATITTVMSENSKGFEVRVKVLQGILRKRRGVGIALIQGVFDVKKINKEDGTGCESIPAGEEATILLVDRAGRSSEEVRLREGLILYKGPPYPQMCTVFKATILTFNPLIPPIIPGSSYELYLHGEEVRREGCLLC
jgi:translation elongation factor EF-1alpha